MNTEPLITLESVVCRFHTRQGMFRSKTFTALKNISFSVYRGETLGIIGLNGAGKSTLLRIICGIFQPSQGSVKFQKKTSIALLNLNVGVDPELPGITNLMLSSMFMGFSKKQTMEKIDSIVRFAELEDWINEPLRTYSTGMRARLGFALALEMAPDVLLIDEVLGVGDQRFKIKSKKAMQDKLLSDQTVIFVSHSIYDVSELCSRVVWIEHGMIQMVDKTEKVLQAYQESIK